VLMDYGTGAIMAVPAHDERDFAFARAHGLPIRVVVQPPEGSLDSSELDQSFSVYGTVVDSGAFTGLPSREALRAMGEYAEEKGFGKRSVTYKLRDWGISRQRYWGTPIPMIHCGACGVVPVPEEDLPVVLPRDVTITGKGQSVLQENRAFVETTCPSCGGPGRRETDTMDTFVDSSWYFYRYTDPKCADQPFRPEVAREWFPIDIYIGGVEHAILHLIYSRFWTRVMRDLGLVEVDEPVSTQISQGMVIKDGAAMSKSKGNIVEPETVIGRYGADTLRLYVLFEAPPEKEIHWTDARLEGPARFVQRFWRFVAGEIDAIASCSPIEGNEEWNEVETALRRKTHQTIFRVTRDVEERFHLNTAISAIMELANELYDAFKAEGERPHRSEAWKAIREATEAILLLLNPFAPHLTEELWEGLGHGKPITAQSWPGFDPAIAAEDTLTLVVQVNGKLRGRLAIAADEDEETVKRRALEDVNVKRYLEGKEIQRVVVVPKRLVNVVVSG
ncbi:MAG: class I tRNA ligase family protein, partial [Vicinamibacteria bacterium]